MTPTVPPNSLQARPTPPTPYARRRRAMGPRGVVVLIALLAVLPIGSVVAAAASPAATSSCSFPGHTGRAARSTTLAEPAFGLKVGDRLTAVYEIEVYNSTASSIHVTVYMPSLFAQFHEPGGGKVEVYVGPHTTNLTNFSWTPSSFASATKTMTTNVTFNRSQPADMTSELIGVMAKVASGKVALGFRWEWSVTFASNGTTVSSPWSVVSTAGSNPSIFVPAPYVGIVSTTNTTVVIGAYFNAQLNGAISSTTFNSELEYASTGNVIRSNGTTTPAGNSTPFTAGVRMLPSGNAPFGPSKMLDHIRNNCGALLHSISLVSVYALHASIGIAVQPAACGPIFLNGTAEANGATASEVPSAAALNLTAPACTGHSFSGWLRTDGLSISSLSSNRTVAVVSADGSLTASYA